MTPPTVWKLRVVEVIRETADAHTLVLEHSEQPGEPFGYLPGQFLTIRIPSDRPGGAARCYSLCSSPVCDEKLKVTVKRTKDGYGSNWICDNVVAGDVLDVLSPSGTFTPASLDTDLLLVAAGSGITPVLSILKSALRAGRGRITLLYANRDENSVIFRDELQTLGLDEHGDRLTVLHWLESVQGLPTAAGLRELLRPYADRETFVCGPKVFMDMVLESLTALGGPPKRVHIERFTSLTGDPFAANENPPEISQDGPVSEVEVTLDGETRTVSWPRSSKLLDVLLAAGLDAPYSCREGACSACACVLLEGEVDLERNEVLDDTDRAEGIILGCQAVPLTDRLKLTYDY
ncbi:ferredoxin--NADP reductase [Saccharopolyspora elongata]|uniref:Ferredoxin--NADP reductase n=1 Tax=Saccharopolyspora elongata TaxID=2530387 RepID=A0A4V2YKF5_9PSEU|nr:ferredoxin--NADP reductase [Saccharopolyspora elongata]TDD42537.1 ferredoxin--NADP reductase [Saccharopolyspora elongata]